MYSMNILRLKHKYRYTQIIDNTEYSIDSRELVTFKIEGKNVKALLHNRIRFYYNPINLL